MQVVGKGWLLARHVRYIWWWERVISVVAWFFFFNESCLILSISCHVYQQSFKFESVETHAALLRGFFVLFL